MFALVGQKVFSMGKTHRGKPPQSGALNGKAKGGDVVSDDVWQQGGKEWCYGVFRDAGNDCAVEAASRVVPS